MSVTVPTIAELDALSQRVTGIDARLTAALARLAVLEGSPQPDPPKPDPKPNPQPIPEPTGPIGERRLVFYISNEFANTANYTDLAQRLVRYVADLNRVLAKSTALRFRYSPNDDLILVDQAVAENPPQVQGNQHVPTQHHFAAYIYRRDGRSAGGSMTRSKVDEFAAIGLGWPAIYADHEKLSHDPVEGITKAGDYVTQVNMVLHELGHAHGIAIGEYYSVVSLFDETLTLPKASEFDCNGPYWSSRQRAKFDPMVGAWAAPTIDQYVSQAAFCELSAKIIDDYALSRLNGPLYFASEVHRIPNSANVVVEVRRNGEPLPKVTVEMFGIAAGNYTSAVYPPLATSRTSNNGQATFDWPGDPNGSRARLFRVEADGLAPQKQWLTMFDLQAHKLIPGGGAVGSFHYHGKLVFEL